MKGSLFWVHTFFDTRGEGAVQIEAKNKVSLNGNWAQVRKRSKGSILSKTKYMNVYDDDKPGDQIFRVVGRAEFRTNSIESIQVYLRQENKADAHKKQHAKITESQQGVYQQQASIADQVELAYYGPEASLC